jgi:hypothetical protein
LFLWRQAFDTASYKKFFLPHVEKIWNYMLETTLERTVDRACSKSYIAILPDDKKAAVRKDVAAIVTEGKDKVWTDELKGTFEYPYRCYVVLAQKK